MMHPQRSDAELVHAYIGGSDEAFETLIYRYKDKIYTTVYMLVKDRFLADDLFQEVFVKIIRTLREGRYAEQGKFLPWALRVAHNLCMDHFRRVKTSLPVTLPDGRDLSEVFFFSTDEGAGDRMEKRQTHASVRELIEALPAEQREVVSLRMWEELSFKEIAEITGVSINTALGRMRYALINLRKMIGEQGMVLR
jgi:RNA polymerase sigma-70 factor (ECF subfamily)